MKKKHIVIALLTIGILLLCLSFALTINSFSTISPNIIGGADFPTFRCVFFSEHNGLYYHLAFLGISGIISALIVAIVKKK